MKTYAMTLQYEGTKYNGWQRQGNTPNTIQEKVEAVLCRMAGSPVEAHASGRTDAGVHAKGQRVSFRCQTFLSSTEIRNYLNHYLPQDIRVISLKEAPERFHARLWAKSKTYEYVICAGEKPDVFSRRTQYAIEEIPDVTLMREGANQLLGTHDFLGFSALRKSKKSTVRTIHNISVEIEGSLIILRFSGSGFLYHMVRILAGTLLEIGLGKKPVSVISDIFKTNRRELAGATLPAEGLTLLEVFYE